MYLTGTSPIPRHSFHSRDRTAAAIAILRELAKIGLCRLLIGGAINAVADLDEQTLVAHAGQITAGNSNVG